MPDPYRIEWTATGIDDVLQLLDYVATHDTPSAVTHVYSKILDRIYTLSTLPMRGRLPPELSEHGITDYRELLAPPYRIFYRVRGRKVYVNGVLDGRRDLGEILLARALNPS